MILATKEVRAVAAQARNAEYTRSKAAGEPRDEDREFRAGLEAAFDHVTSTHTTARDEDIDEKLREVLTVGGYRTDGDFATLIERVHFMALSNRDLALMQETLIKRHEETKANLPQPQPVAQGEAVWRMVHAAGGSHWLDGEPTPKDEVAAKNWGNRIERAYIHAIPTGHRVVPVDLLTVALEANDMCRSAFQVAERVATQYSTVYAGTNFGALHEQLKKSLDRQHQVLKPYREAALAASPSAGGV